MHNSLSTSEANFSSAPDTDLDVLFCSIFQKKIIDLIISMIPSSHSTSISTSSLSLSPTL
jgi:hypothetical protein